MLLGKLRQFDFQLRTRNEAHELIKLKGERLIIQLAAYTFFTVSMADCIETALISSAFFSNLQNDSKTAQMMFVMSLEKVHLLSRMSPTLILHPGTSRSLTSVLTIFRRPLLAYDAPWSTEMQCTEKKSDEASGGG